MSHPSPHRPSGLNASPAQAGEPAPGSPVRSSCETTLQTELYLEAGGKRFSLAQACHRWLIPREGTDLPAGPARVVSVIDGHTDVWAVLLAKPHRASDRRMPIRDLRVVTNAEAA